MLDKSLLDKNDTDSEDEDNDVSPSSHVQSPPPPSTTTTTTTSSSSTTTTTTIRKLSRPIDQPSLQQPPVSLLPMHHATCSSSSSTSHGFSNQRNNYRSESSLSSSHHPEDDDMHTERNGDEEEDDEYDDDGHSSSASYHLSDHHHHHHHQQQQQQQSSSSTPLPTPPPPPTSLPPTSQQFFPNHPQFRHHLATHYEQATLPSPNSVSGSYSSITESNINQRIKFMVKNAKKSSIDKKKSQRIGGIKSRPIKYLKHPLDRSIASFFLLTLFFTLLALITGLPVVLTLTLLLALSMLLIKCLNCSCKGYPANMVQATPIETFWLNPNDFTNSSSTKSNSNPMVSGNNNENNDTVNPNPENEENSTNDHLNPCNCLIPNSISTCLLFVDSELNIDQLRDIFMARIVQKPEMARFRSILTYKGLTRTPIWSRLSYEEFSIEKQIINDRLISSKEELKMHLLTLMRTNLSPNLPLWQIRRCSATYLNQVILILRIHQSVIDGCGLAKLLVQYLADQPPPKTTTFIRTTQGTTASTSHFKPRFGGINFTINLIRAAIVGPLTFSLWVIWAFTRRKNNYLSKVAVVKKSPRSTAMVHNDSKKDKLVLSSSSSKNSCSNSKYLDEAIISNNSNGENIINNATRNTNAITTSSPPLNYNNNNNGSWTEQSNQHTSNHNTQQQQQQNTSHIIHQVNQSTGQPLNWIKWSGLNKLLEVVSMMLSLLQLQVCPLIVSQESNKQDKC
ncbi:uncharacterized protein LOC128391800 isoform X2 [Panonychus citri]|uniref:uncharacterized protein LOC128391800 isoform X2 n=1 Tax=Panonychus citri TaxID=50023 RepID=UPI0023074C13|nr:uncharacterized protein LOC128391800 isoform X2 [Panonychus citri]